MVPSASEPYGRYLMAEWARRQADQALALRVEPSVARGLAPAGFDPIAREASE